MLRRMFGLLGIGVLLLGIASTCLLLDHAQGQVVALNDEAMAQLIGGANERKAAFRSGTIDADTLVCPTADDDIPEGGCSATDWEKRKYSKCVACSPGEKKYTPTKKHWYKRLHECFTTSVDGLRYIVSH